MSKHNTFRKVIAATAIASAIGLTSLVSGAASADGPQSFTTIEQSHVLVSPLTATRPISAGTQTDAKKPGRTTFANIVLERGNVVPAADVPSEQVAFYYNRIAFNYAASK